MDGGRNDPVLTKTESEKAYADTQEATATLKEKPDDPEANLALGKYRCFNRGDWDKGLPMLAKGDDGKLKALAEKDIAGAASAKEQAKLADAWWNVSRGRAIYWYEQALPGLAGLEKDRVEKRIGEAGVGNVADDNTPAANALRKGLEWLISQQQSDGHWTFTTGPNPGNLANSPCCATAMALIPLLRAGYTHREGEYREVINKGLKFLAHSMTGNKIVGNLFEPGSKCMGRPSAR